ncbi:excalibur calcium-binding domain-containing protein [Lysobacter zhanggongensis]|uniref:Excalibur calcium-binding domain-containing protein n=1 Tax=Lysobacter zhanggongensis TaxID=1774951 RepID=A0ABU7YKY3_9GAMM
MPRSNYIRCLVLAFIAVPALAFGHPGGLNSEGCHNNRKTGDYHCHRAPPAASSSAPRPGLAPTYTAPRQQGAFANCASARAAGAAPVRRGDPGYGPHLDRDNDGVGCE